MNKLFFEKEEVVPEPPLIQVEQKVEVQQA